MVDYTESAQAVVKQYQGAAGSLNADQSPDDAARAFELEKATGAPAEGIAQDIPSFEEFHKRQLGQQIINDNPDVAGFINSHPLHGQLIHDDLGNLDEYSRAYRRIAPGGHPINEAVKGFAEGFRGLEGFGHWQESTPEGARLSQRYPFASQLWTAIGAPIELGARTFSGVVEGAHRAVRAFAVNAGMDESHADSFANEAAGMLEYQLIKPEMKIFVPRGETIFEYPKEGEVLPPEKPIGGLPPKRPETIEGEAIPSGRAVIESFVKREADATRPFLEAGKRPPTGASDIFDEIEAQQTELSQKATDEVLKARDQTALAERSPEKLEEFTKQLPKGITRIGIEAFDALGEKASKEFDWIPNLEQKLAARPAAVSVPTNIYIAKVDKEIHDQIKEFVAHGEDMTPAEVKELKEAKAAKQEVPQDLTPEDAALKTLRDSSGLSEMYPWAETLPFDQVSALLDLVDRKAPPEELLANPYLQQFEDIQEKQGRGPPLAEVKERLPSRVYNIDGQQVGYPQIIDRLLARALAGTTLKFDRTVTLVLGPPGAGKSSIIRPYAKKTGSAIFGSDEVKDVIPEYQGGLGQHVQRESTILTNEVFGRLMDQGGNIVIEKIGNNWQEIAPQIEGWKANGYKVNLIHVWAPMEELGYRIVGRFIKTGRYVPLRYAQSVVNETKPGFDKLKEVINGSSAAYETTGLAPGSTPTVIEGKGGPIDIAVGGGRGHPPDDAVPPGEGPQGRKRIFVKAKAFGRSEKEYSAYEDLIAQRDKEDIQWRLDRAQKQAKRENAKDWKDEVDRITPEVRDEIATRPEIQAYRFFQDGAVFGRNLARRPKLTLTDEQKVGFPERFVAKRGGYDPDAVANLFGFDSGDELIAAISSMEREAEGKGDIVDRLTQAEVNRRVQEKLGETAEERLEEVYDHALSITQLEQLHEQMLRLGTRVGTEISIPPMATKLGALNLLHEELFGGMSSARYLRDSGRFSRRLEKALLADDPVEAFQNAQAQYISAEMAKEARQVEKEEKVFNRTVKRFSKREVSGIDPEYTNWIHDVLNRLGVGNRPQADIDTEIGASPYSTLQAFSEAKANMGREIYLPDFLLDPTFAKPIEDMTVLEARRAMAGVRSLVKNGRDELRVIREGEKIDRKELLDQMMERLEALGPAAQFEGKPGVYNKIRNGMRTYLAATLQIESLLNRWDRGNAFGVFNQWIGRPLIEAANSEAALQKEIAKDYLALPNHLTKDELAKPIPNTIFKDPLEAWQSDGTWDWDGASPLPLTRKELRAILLNVGNSSNLKKLADGYGLKPEVILDWANTYAKKEDWDWAQAHGDMFKKLKDMSDRMYRTLSGVAPESVEVAPLQTKFGEYRGWYHPLIYDPIIDGAIEKARAPKDLFEKEYTRANTPAAYTKARTNFVGPLSLSLDQVPARLTQEIHDISFHAPVVEASKIFYDPRFLNGVTKYYGKEYSQLFIPWLKDIANAKNYTGANQAALERFAGYFRQNVIGTFVGLNPRTVEKHTLTALFNSIKEVGGEGFLDAAMSLFNDNGRGESNWDFAMRTSEELQRRHQNFMEQVSGAQETALGGGSLRQTMLRAGTTPVAFFDLLSAVPTWMAEYKKTMDDGRSLGDAIFAGNRAVRRAHGSTAITSRPAVMRAYPGIASLYNFMNRMAQYQYELGWKARDLLTGKAEGNKAEWTKDVMLGLFVNVLLVGLVDVAVSDLTDKDSYASTIAKSIATGVAAPWWIARDIMHAVLHHSDPTLGLASTELKALTDAIRDVDRKDWGISKDRLGKTVKHVNNMLGVATGMTNAEIGNLAEYLIDLGSGKAKPKTVGDWWRGMTKGNIKQTNPDLVERGLRVITGGR
jgi:predicted ABC-type ATPase